MSELVMKCLRQAWRRECSGVDSCVQTEQSILLELEIVSHTTVKLTRILCGLCSQIAEELFF